MAAIPDVMRAAVLADPGHLRVEELPVPEPGPEDVLVRVHRASLCGTDLKIRSRAFFPDGGPPPGTFVPGHEYAGRVVAVGSTVDEFRVGDRVVTEAHRGCMRCANCLSGSYTACLNSGRHEKGHRTQGMTVNGGFADYALNHVSTLHRLPDEVSFDAGVVLTTVGTVMHAFDVLGDLLVGARVAVLGPGPIGLLAVQVAKALGAELVALLGTRASRLELGKIFGVSWDQACQTLAQAMFDTLGEHRKVAPLLIEQTPIGPNAMVLRERSLAVLLDGGLSPGLAARAYATLARYVLGFAIQLAGSGNGAEQKQVSEHFHNLSSTEYPATLAVADSLPVPLEDEFAFGLELIINGLRRLHAG